MTDHEKSPPVASAMILRKPGQIYGRRRLPGLERDSLGNAFTSDLNNDPSAEDSKVRETLSHVYAIELDELKEEARQRGLREGQIESQEILGEIQTNFERKLEEKGAILSAELNQERQKFIDLVAALEKQKLEFMADMQPEIGRVVAIVCAKILGRHAIDHALITDMAKQAIIEHQISPICIYVSAEDYERTRRYPGGEDVLAILKVDQNAEVGSCVIDFGTGQLDASLERQIQSLKAILLKKESERSVVDCP